jgi:ubiquinone/menaquinone biosynthesis C-methylase UbiE
MYKNLAKYYDLVYAGKDYRREAKEICRVILKYKRSKGNSLLEVACGTGRYLEHMRRDFSCMGLDLNEPMLRIARRRLPGIRLVRGNMADFSLDKEFDVITCLFSSIGYLKTYDRLGRALRNFSKHLKTGGVVVIAPWLTKATYKVGTTHLSIYDGKDIKVARANISNARKGLSILEMHYLVAEDNKGVKHFVSTEELGMFETARTLELMRKAGLDARFLKEAGSDKRGLFVGIKLRQDA